MINRLSPKLIPDPKKVILIFLQIMNPDLLIDCYDIERNNDK